MSYDISLHDPRTKEILHAAQPHQLRGGTFVAGGTTALELNVTYNYATIFYRVLGERGIRTIYGMTGAESVSVLEKAAAMLKDEKDEDYWKPTEGNAKAALAGLIELAKMALDGVWEGD
jgi:hypothetical protein